MELRVPSAEELAMMSPAALEEVAQAIEVVRRQAEAAMALLVQRVDASGAYLTDGHRRAAAWGRATNHWSGPEASRMVKLGRAMGQMPGFQEACLAGRIGISQMHAIGQVTANPRVKSHLADADHIFTDAAKDLPFEEFSNVLRHWEQLADEDGARSRHDRAISDRRAAVRFAGERAYLDAQGPAFDGLLFDAVLDRYVDLEWRIEWDVLKAIHGESMHRGLMERTDAQRRFDALQRLFADATAGTFGVPEPAPPLPVVHLGSSDDLRGAHRSTAHAGSRAARTDGEPPRDDRGTGHTGEGEHAHHERSGHERSDHEHAHSEHADHEPAHHVRSDHERSDHERSDDEDSGDGYIDDGYIDDEHAVVLGSTSPPGGCTCGRSSPGSSGPPGRPPGLPPGRSPGRTQPPTPGVRTTIDVFIDKETFDRELAKLLGDVPPPPSPAAALRRRAQDANGRVVDPRAVVLAAVREQVRRVVYGTDGVVLDMGRRARLFTGPLREAVMMAAHGCTFVGCHLKVEHTEADHLVPWAELGATKVSNGGPGCGHHNRWKNNGARTVRDAKGLWHTYRADGTEIGWPRLYTDVRGLFAHTMPVRA